MGLKGANRVGLTTASLPSCLQPLIIEVSVPTVTTPARIYTHMKSTYTRTDMSGVQTLSNTQTSRNLSISDTRTTNSDKDWRTKVAKKASASLGYKIVRTKHFPTRAYCTTYGIAAFGPPKAYYSGECLMVPAVDPTPRFFVGDDVALRDQALTRLKRKLAAQASQMNIMVPIAEIGELRKLLKSLAFSAITLLYALGELQRGNPLKAAKQASDLWLTWSFGVKPTLSDIKSACEAIDHWINGKDRFVKLTGSASKEWFDTATTQGLGAFKADSYTKQVYRHTLSYRYVGGFGINPMSGNNYSAGAQFGLEFGAIIPTFWELIPFSWIVDYFTTMGHYLDDTFVSASGELKYLVLDRRYTCDVVETVDFKVADRALDTIHSKYSSTGGYMHFNFERFPLSTLPHPALRFKTFDEIGVNVVSRLLNLASVFVAGHRPSRG